ncbi:hypothetical protein T484DRAFT_1883685 [Baffinella frigidus]|nr:hypothetical protein T484DRAFT_1883685 [Cryptophyta sp. CCMP2293]
MQRGAVSLVFVATAQLVLLMLVCARGEGGAEDGVRSGKAGGPLQLAAESGATAFPAIAVTVRRPENFEQWLCYHLGVGFRHVFVFFDEPDDPAMAITARFPASRVSTHVRGAALEERWAHQSLFGKFGPWRESEVMARQMLNVQVAIEELRGAAISGGIHAGGGVARWLLHIDADELLASAMPAGVGGDEEGAGFAALPHFEALSREGFRQAIYLNMEGIPERELKEGDSPFTNITLFKRNQITFSAKGTLAGKLTGAYQDWQRTKGNYAQGYFTGKAAARVDGDITPFPLEVTRFFFPKGSAKRAIFDNPAVLHFINPSPHALLAKYQMLGDFADENFAASVADHSRQG